MIVDHSNKQMNSYFVAYLNAHDIKDGEDKSLLLPEGGTVCGGTIKLST